MALAKENARTSALREYIDRRVSVAVGLRSPTMNVALGGLKKNLKSLESSAGFSNVTWGVGGTTYDWRVVKYRSKATTDTGEFGIRDYSQPDLHANPSVSLRYMHHQTWAIGEGDLNMNRAAGETKILDLKKERMQDAAQAIAAEMALQWWNINETNHNAGLSYFNETNVAASSSYAGIAMNTSTTNGTDTFYYWNPGVPTSATVGYDYGTKTFGGNLIEILGAMVNQMTLSTQTGGGSTERPDFGVCDPVLWPYILLYFDTKASFNIDKVANLNFLEQGFQNLQVCGLTIYPDDNFGGSTGYVTGANTEDLLVGYSNKMFIATTNTKAEGLVTSESTQKGDMALIRGMAGVFKTGNQAIGFRAPRYFQCCLT